ncbi:hypothetical protein Bpfe_026603 [Biomphalaria pfeifferi]|uniref:Uncharacterized protein n=1 Tax=Biomphalaria pfeifferi TaxID=112525 RepID=A0AAD8AWZ2_BIOPF|nr:hypothetical protein Bpfe_026603 [Biomphalaria pfeifferi]
MRYSKCMYTTFVQSLRPSPSDKETSAMLSTSSGLKQQQLKAECTYNSRMFSVPRSPRSAILKSIDSASSVLSLFKLPISLGERKEEKCHSLQWTQLDR